MLMLVCKSEVTLTDDHHIPQKVPDVRKVHSSPELLTVDLLEEASCGELIVEAAVEAVE